MLMFVGTAASRFLGQVLEQTAIVPENFPKRSSPQKQSFILPAASGQEKEKGLTVYGFFLLVCGERIEYETEKAGKL
ncbi:MAG TPA: hypothetical protein VF191_05500 [Cyclobacteriaceae bacterium]